MQKKGRFYIHGKQKSRQSAIVGILCGDLLGVRTQDPILKRDVLYQLS